MEFVIMFLSHNFALDKANSIWYSNIYFGKMISNDFFTPLAAGVTRSYALKCTIASLSFRNDENLISSIFIAAIALFSYLRK
jgi:hypothetical protein